MNAKRNQGLKCADLRSRRASNAKRLVLAVSVSVSLSLSLSRNLGASAAKRLVLPPGKKWSSPTEDLQRGASGKKLL